MTGLFTKAIAALVAAGVVYSGPVAACVCADRVIDQHAGALEGESADDQMASMPCCPEEPEESDPSHDSWSDSRASAACDPVPADLLPVSAHDVPAPVAMAVTAWAWPARGPPDTGAFDLHELQRTSPIYLTTRRLRI